MFQLYWNVQDTKILFDRLGQRPLMLVGCIGIGLSHLLAGFAHHAGQKGAPVLILTLCAIACYVMTLAPLTWVLIAEIFPNRLPSLGVSASWCQKPRDERWRNSNRRQSAADDVKQVVGAYRSPYTQRSITFVVQPPEICP